MTGPPLAVTHSPDEVQDVVDAMLLSLPGNYLLAELVDAEGHVRNPGSCTLRPYGRSASCDLPWFKETYGTVTAIDLRWNFVSPTTIWPIWDAVFDGPRLMITGQRGRLWLSGNRPACGSCISLDTCGSTTLCVIPAPARD